MAWPSQHPGGCRGVDYAITRLKKKELVRMDFHSERHFEDSHLQIDTFAGGAGGSAQLGYRFSNRWAGLVRLTTAFSHLASTQSQASAHLGRRNRGILRLSGKLLSPRSRSDVPRCTTRSLHMATPIRDAPGSRWVESCAGRPMTLVSRRPMTSPRRLSCKREQSRPQVHVASSPPPKQNTVGHAYLFVTSRVISVQI